MDADDVDEVLELEGDDDGQHADDRHDDEEDGEEMADQTEQDEEADGEPDVAADATVTEADNSAHTGREHTDSVYCVALRRVGETLTALTGSGDDSGMLWSVGAEGLAPVARLGGHSDTVAACGISNSGKAYCATASYDGTVRIHSSAGALLHVIEGPASDIEWMQWHEKGDVLLAGCSDATCWMWSVTDKEAACMQVFAGHDDAVTCGTFAAQGKVAVTGSGDQTVRVWEPKTGKVSITFSG